MNLVFLGIWILFFNGFQFKLSVQCLNGFNLEGSWILIVPDRLIFCPRPCAIGRNTLVARDSEETRREFSRSPGVTCSEPRACVSILLVRLTGYSPSMNPHISFIARDFFKVISQFASSLVSFHCT